jgi:hypothetical protein
LASDSVKQLVDIGSYRSARGLDGIGPGQNAERSRQLSPAKPQRLPDKPFDPVAIVSRTDFP